MPTVLERVEALIERLAPEAACDDCIADDLSLSVRQHANIKTRELERRPGYRRAVGSCAFCKRSDKKVIARA